MSKYEDQQFYMMIECRLNTDWDFVQLRLGVEEGTKKGPCRIYGVVKLLERRKIMWGVIVVMLKERKGKKLYLSV